MVGSDLEKSENDSGWEYDHSDDDHGGKSGLDADYVFFENLRFFYKIFSQ